MFFATSSSEKSTNEICTDMAKKLGLAFSVTGIKHNCRE